MVRIASSLAALVAVSQLAAAQTFSDCDPTKKAGCAPRAGLNQAEYSIDFKAGKGEGASSVWKNMAKAVTFGDNGAEFSLKAIGDSVTYATDFYIFFGYVEVKMRAAPGAGIVSSFVLQSDDLDEIDWEMIGSETDKVQSNYFGKGNTTTYDRGGYHNVQTPADTMHTYALNWTKESTTWLIDGTPVRTVKYADALGGLNYPQTPMNIRLGNWIGGSPGNSPGTIKWAGGEADMSKGPYNMYIESVKIKNYNPAAAYEYGDSSGSWQSIKVTSNSNSKAASAVASPAAASPAAASPAAASQANSGQVKAASSAPAAAASAQPKGSPQAKPPQPPANGGANGKHDQKKDGHDDNDECDEGIEPAGPKKPAGTITVTPQGEQHPPAAATPTPDVKPSQAVAVVSADAAPSSLVSSTSVPAVAAVTPTPSLSPVVSFPLGSGAPTTTYQPLQVSASAASGIAVQLLFVAALAAFSTLGSLAM